MSDGSNAPPSLDANDRVGMLLKGKWTLDRLLGVGGMASVYLATHRNGSKVAVKVLHAHLAAHPDTLRRFLREGYLSNKVEHPDVVHVLDDDIGPDGSPFLVMELLDGRSLDTLLEENGAFPLSHAVDIVSKVLTVLEAAHEKGIVHRDLKPANIFLLRGGAIKVLDFGIARLHEMTMPHAATMGGAVLGTPSFMPPEQARGRWDEVDARSDLWAMGATLFMLLTNRSVREEAETANEALMYAMAKPVAPMAELVPALPRPIASVIDRALAFEKLARFPTAATMREALAAALEAVGRGVGDTMIDPPAAGNPLQTGAASPFVPVQTPAGLGPGGALAGTTPSSMPRFGPASAGGSAPPVPLFTSPHLALPAAPAITPQFALRSLTPTGTSQASQLPAPAHAASPTPKVAIAAVAGLGVILVLVVLGAFVLSRDDRPAAPKPAAASGTTEPSAASADAVPPAAASVTGIALGDPPSTSAVASSATTTTTTKSTTKLPPGTAKTRTPPTPTKNPLDQGRF